MRDEVILTLEKYFQLNIGKVSVKSEEVVDLSHILTRLLITTTGDSSLHRGANSVLMKLMNFRSLDPAYKGVGLKKAAKQDKVVWGELAHDRQKLKQTAAAIRAALDSSVLDAPAQSEILSDDEVFSEGRVLTYLHKSRERNTKVVKAKINVVLQQTGKLACEVCDFDFYEVYGELGNGFIECHHIRPLAESGAKSDTKISDLALVCPNCHRMLHRSNPLLSVEELRRMMK